MHRPAAGTQRKRAQVKAYLLAAGYATRMFPLTRDRAKPLLEVGGLPILTHLINRVARLDDLSEIVVIANHRFARDFDAWLARLDCAVPVRVLDDGSMDDGDKLGAVGDIAFALREVPPGNEDWVVVAGDNLLAFELDKVHRFFVQHRAPTLALRTVTPGPGPSPYNEVSIDEASRVVRMREKPLRPQTDLAAIALYFFTPAVHEHLTRYLAEGGNPDAPGYFVAWLVDRTKVVATRFEGEWFDIGSLESYDAACRRFES